MNDIHLSNAYSDVYCRDFVRAQRTHKGLTKGSSSLPPLFGRKLQSLVKENSWSKHFKAMELKFGEIEPEYIGKMQFYLAALDTQMREEGKNPSIGIILCKEKSRTIVEYALRDASRQIGIETNRIVSEPPRGVHYPGTHTFLPMTSNKDKKYLSTLTDDQARRVFMILLDEHPSLIPRAVEIARDFLVDIDEEKVSAEVCDALLDLDVHDLWEQSGKTRHGYVDPNEYSYEMMEERIEPFLDALDRYLEREMIDDALAYTRGIIRGICVYMFEEAGEFADWAVDNEDGLTYDVVERWKRKNNVPVYIEALEKYRELCLKKQYL